MAYGSGMAKSNGMKKAMPKTMKDKKVMKAKMDKKKKDRMKDDRDMKSVASKKGLTAAQKKLPKKLQEAILRKQKK